MTNEEAIEYWEGLRKTFSSQLEKEENHFGRMHLQTTIDALDMAISALRQQEQERKAATGEGLRCKYIVRKADTGEGVDGCFVLRPDRDRAAVAALRAYAAATDNDVLATDILNWVGQESNEPLTLDELRQMDGEPVYCVEITGREEWLFRRDSGFSDMYGEFTSDDFMVWDNYGKLWWGYRQKPEEDKHEP